jgi:hypothetical protein
MFRSSTVIRELALSLAKVILKHWVKLCPYTSRLCGSVAACLGVAWHTTHTPPQDMLPHHHITYKDIILPSALI